MPRYNTRRYSPRQHRTRSLATGYAFISYSSRDWNIVSRLIEGLKDSGVWVDKRNVELGDALPDKIEAGVAGATTFILILSKSSLESRWVKYESHMATIRHLEDSNFRIVVLKIDDCKVPLRFQAFLYADLTKDASALESVVRTASSKTDSAALYRRHFVNRAEELGKIELCVADAEISVVCLHGFYGIGKRTLADESIRRTWQSPRIAAIELSVAHTGARLAAELCAMAGLAIPTDGAPSGDLRRSAALAVETLATNNRILVFDHLEHLLDEQGRLHADIDSVIEHFASFPSSLRVPCYVLSRRLPKFHPSIALRVGYIRVGGMDDEHIATILESEASRLRRSPVKDNAPLRIVAKHLYGYPLAGRLAAPLILKYSAEYLLDNLAHITGLRRDIAEAILANVTFSDDQVRILQTLAVCDSPLAVDDLASIGGRDPDDIVADIDVLVDHNLLDSEGVLLKLHPLVSDFYWKQARSSPSFMELVSRIADYAKGMLGKQRPDSVRFVEWLATACRALFLSNRADEAYNLRRDFSGELKVAAIELYQRGEYEISLKYCDAYLNHDAGDFEISIHRARNLSRTGKPEESLAAIGELLKKTMTPARLARLYFAKGRAYWEMRKLDPALEAFLKALEYRPRSLPALQGVAEVLLAQGKVNDAAGFVDRALAESPMDSFALSMQADILWRQGRYREAIETMTLVVKAQPENATFLFRLGRFFQLSGMPEDAYDYFKRAKASDKSFIDPRLSLASTAIDLGKLDEAKAEIDSLKGRGSPDKRFVLNEIEAQYHLAIGEIDIASGLAEKALEFHRNKFTLSLMANVEVAKAKRADDNGMTILADSHKKRALQLLDEGLKEDPTSPVLLNQRRRVMSSRGGL